MKRLSTMAAVMLAVAALATGAQAEIILLNGGFEAPDVGTEYQYGTSDWTPIPASGYVLTMSKEYYVDHGHTPLPIEGNQLIQIHFGCSGISQQLGTVAAGEEDITLSFSYGVRSDMPSVLSSIKIGLYSDSEGNNALADTTFTAAAVGTWYSGSVSATGIAVGTDVYARAVNTLGGITAVGNLLDGMSVAVVPEPSSLVLACAGAMCLLLLCLRRRHKTTIGK